MMIALKSLVFLFLVGFWCQLLGFAQDPTRWERFRGPNGSGVAPFNGIEFPWQETNVTKVPLPGVGHGSPVVHAGIAYLMSADPEAATRFLSAIDIASGNKVWQKEFPSQTYSIHKFSSYASSTPCANDSHVYFAWAEPSHTYLKAFTHDGEEAWSRDFGPYVTEHGFGSSPMCVGNLVILLNSQDGEAASDGELDRSDRMIAMDFQSGETVWESKLPMARVCYGVPCIWENNGEQQLLCSTTAQGMFGLSLKDGSLLWYHDCFTQRVCSSSLLVGDLMIGTHGSGGGRDNMLVALDLSTKQERFRITRAAPYVPSPVATSDTLFMWGDAGIVGCVDLESGKTLWTKRIGGDYSGSPIILGDKLINVSQTGRVHVLRASREFELLATIDTELAVRSTLVPAGDSLLLRGEEELWIIHGQK